MFRFVVSPSCTYLTVPVDYIEDTTISSCHIQRTTITFESWVFNDNITVCVAEGEELRILRANGVLHGLGACQGNPTCKNQKGSKKYFIQHCGYSSDVWSATKAGLDCMGLWCQCRFLCITCYVCCSSWHEQEFGTTNDRSEVFMTGTDDWLESDQSICSIPESYQSVTRGSQHRTIQNLKTADSIKHISGTVV